MVPVVELRGVRKRYFRGEEALKGVSLAVKEGEAVGLVGPNGAGKTTLIKLVLGLLKPTAGEVRVWGHDSISLRRYLKLRIGYLLEEPGLYDVLTVEENLTFWAKVYGVGQGAIETALRAWGLWSERKKKAKALSAGMRQRLSLARCTLHDPRFVVLDEPTSNLDPEARHEVVNLLIEFTAQGRSLLLTSHDLFDVERITGRIVLLRRGVVVAQGSIEELKAQLGVGTEVRIRVAQSIPDSLMQELCEAYGAKRLSEREFSVPGDKEDIGHMVRHLVEQGLDVMRVEEEKRTLEDLYLTIVKEDEGEGN